MDGIDKLNSGNVIIKKGRSPSASILPKKDQNDTYKLELTIVPGVTTSEDIKSMLSQLNIHEFSNQELERISNGDNIFDEPELEQLDENLESVLDYNRVLSMVQASAVYGDNSVSYLLTPENANNSAYIRGLVELNSAGITVDRALIYFLRPECGRDPDYIKGLIELNKAGLEVTHGKAEYLSLKKGSNIKYVKAVIELYKAGCMVDDLFIEWLPFESAINPDYISAIKKFRQMNIKIDNVAIKSLDLARVINPAFQDTIIAIVRSGNNPRSAIINLTIEKANDPAYLEALLKFQRSGIVVFEEYQTLFIMCLTLENSKDKGFIQALIALHRSGIAAEDSVSSLSIEMANDPNYINSLISLRKMGVNPTHNGGLVTYLLDFQKGKNPDYMNTIMELQKAGCAIDYDFMNDFSLEDANDKQFVDALTILSKNGIPISRWELEKLRGKKSKNPNFVNNMVILHNAKIDVLNDIDEEKGANLDYINALIALKKSGIDVTSNSFIYQFSIARMSNPVYMDILRSLSGSIYKTDDAYIKKISGPDLSARDATSDLINAYIVNISDDTYEEISSHRLKIRMESVVYEMNAHHNGTDAERLSYIGDFKAQELYYLIAFGTNEAYTSTFNLIFRQMMKKMRTEGKPADALISKADPTYRHYRTILAACASYGRLTEFLATIHDRSNKEDLLRRFIVELNSSKERMKDAVSIITLIKSETDTNIIRTLKGHIMASYSGSSDTQLKRLYAYIGAICYKYHPLLFDDFAKEYPVIISPSIPIKDLVNSNNEIIEQQFYYNDDDGRMNYEDFINKCSNDPAWKIEDKGSYSVLSKSSASGVKLIIYANKYNMENSLNDIQKEFTEKKLSASIIIHRGHSYHVEKTKEHITSSARIVYLGSCGGFGEILSVLKRSNKANIISTQGKGTITINSPLIIKMHELILSSEALSWETLWDKTEKVISNKEDFRFYVRPDKNIAVQLINSFYSTTDNR
jgi:hypothetical protein